MATQLCAVKDAQAGASEFYKLVVDPGSLIPPQLLDYKRFQRLTPAQKADADTRILAAGGTIPTTDSGTSAVLTDGANPVYVDSTKGTVFPPLPGGLPNQGL